MTTTVSGTTNSRDKTCYEGEEDNNASREGEYDHHKFSP